MRLLPLRKKTQKERRKTRKGGADAGRISPDVLYYAVLILPPAHMQCKWQCLQHVGVRRRRRSFWRLLGRIFPLSKLCVYGFDRRGLLLRQTARLARARGHEGTQ